MIFIRNGRFAKSTQVHTNVQAKVPVRAAGTGNAKGEEEVVRRLLAYTDMKLSAEAAPGPAKADQETGQASNVQPFVIPPTRIRPPEQRSLLGRILGPLARPQTYGFEDFLTQYVRRKWTLSERQEGFRERPTEKLVTTIHLGEIGRSEAWPTSESTKVAKAFIGASGTLYLCITRIDRFFDTGPLFWGIQKATGRTETWYVLKQPQEMFDKAAKLAGFPS